MQPGEVTIERVDPDDPDAVACIRAYYALLGERFPIGFDPAVLIPVDGDAVRPPRGCFLLARHEGRAVGCVGLKLHEGASAEMKRLWVDRSMRGLGLGGRLVEAIEAEARAAGAPGVRLDTNETLVEAIAMYRSRGYVEIPPFTDEPFATHWFERRFDASTTEG